MSTHVQRCLHMFRGVYICSEVSTHAQRCLHMLRGVYTCSEVSTHVQRCLHMCRGAWTLDTSGHAKTPGHQMCLEVSQNS